LQAQASAVGVTKRLQPARRHPQTGTIPHAAPQTLATLAKVSGNPQNRRWPCAAFRNGRTDALPVACPGAVVRCFAADDGRLTRSVSVVR
jgi:hypothetical protein